MSKEKSVYINSQVKSAPNIYLRVITLTFLVFIGLVLAVVRVVNLVTILIGICLVLKADYRAGRVIGWFLIAVAVFFTVFWYVVYSVPGGMFF